MVDRYIDCPVRKETVRFTKNSGYDMNCMTGVVKFTDRCTLVPELTLSV